MKRIKDWLKVSLVGLVTLSIAIISFAVGTSVNAAQTVDYTISKYQGTLTLEPAKSDGTQRAIYEEAVDYDFSSTYNGQYLTLGQAGNTPEGFKIANDPQIEVIRNGQQLATSDYQVSSTENSDALVTKVYNAGNAGDQVRLIARYELDQPLFAYRDSFVLNWVPISDWDETINNVSFKVVAPVADQKAQLAVHQGYFIKPVQINKTENVFSFNVPSINAGSDLALHGIWQASTFGGAVSDASAYFDKFKATEAGITRRSQLMIFLYRELFPVIASVLFVVSLAWLIYKLHQLKIKQLAPKNLRIYDLPDDTKPLLMASQVYSIDLDELSVAGKSRSLGFKDLVMATITDLIDRGALQLVDDKMLAQVADKANILSPAEKRLVAMIFNDQQQVTFENMFAGYQINQSLDKVAMQVAGVKAEESFNHQVKLLADEIRAELKAQEAAVFFRPLTSGEKFQLILPMIMLGLAVGLFALVFAVLMAGGDQTPVALIAIISAVLATISLLVVGFKFNKMRRDGLVTKTGVEKQAQWQGFRNMLKEIAHLDDDELAAIVLWNRYLVYATAFGLADEVLKLIKLKHLNLTGNLSQTADGSYLPMYLALNYSLATTVTGFTTAASINTGSGGFGGGGGFSGGFGGGGGGAF